MYQFPIGVMTDSFRLPFFEALKQKRSVQKAFRSTQQKAKWHPKISLPKKDVKF